MEGEEEQEQCGGSCGVWLRAAVGSAALLYATWAVVSQLVRAVCGGG